ncbi:MAG TPA: oligosaccharide flippase family protein, partial [Patescibacteria group bacterium]
EIKLKTTVNIFFLSLRNFGIRGISIIGYFILSLILGPGDVGLFAIVSESIGILGYFSDVGLASALIQQKSEVNKEDLQTTFVIQQLLVFISLVIVAYTFPGIARSKHYGSKETWILISLCFAFVAASLKTIPSVLLERQLNFKLISTIDIIENTSFYVIAVIFAILGFGTYSYVIATFSRSLLGLIIIYIKSPWPIGYSFSKNSAKKLFSYGIPFQLNSFIAVAKDRLSNLFVAGIIGRDAFGILSWAQKGPSLPLGLMDAFMRVTFPTFSRLQDHHDHLKKSLEKSVYYIAFFSFPILAGISLVAPDVINIIPKYGKWLPAVIPLYFYAANAAIASVTTPLTNAFNAVGKITLTTKLMVMWTVLTWIFYPFLSYRYSYYGAAAASLIVGSSSFIVWYISYKQFGVNVFKTILNPLIASLLMLILILPLNLFIKNLYILLPLKTILGIGIYFLYQSVFSRQEVIWFKNQLLCLKDRKLS